MVNSCVAFGCTNRRIAGSGITFHRIPKDPMLREAWIQAIRRKDWNPSANAFLCSEHFKEEDFNKRYASHLVTLKKGVVPSIFKEFPSYLQKVQKTKKVPFKRPAPANSETREFIADETCSNTEDSPVKKTLKVKLTKTSLQLKKAKIQVKGLQQTKRRLQKRLLSYKNILLELKNKNLIIDEYYELLNNIPEISKEINLRLKKKHNKYSPQLRSFALTLNFLSPKAYCYVRKQFDTGLPHPRTISKWYESLDASPGFCKEALAALKAKSSTSQYPVFCSLIVDEMAIRQHVEWNGEQYVGYIDIGTHLDGDERSVAKEVFVLLVNCINSNWKLPVGYFFTAGLSGEQRASVILNCLRWLSEANVNIVSLTCDGAVSNFSMMKNLGCSFELDDFKTFFLHPTTQQPIYFFLDPCHALKLVRNTFGDKGVLIDYEHKIIQWEHIVNLNKLQEEEGLHLANKLKRHHVFWKKQPMKVNLAAQLFSDSVGDALQFCLEKEIHGFQDASGTIRFIKLFNRLFDILNSRSIHQASYKKAMCTENYSTILQFFSEAKFYIENLSGREKTPLVLSNRKTGFLGFLICIESSKGVFEKLVKKEELKYIPLYKFNQDNIELLFGYIRSKFGCNNNPTCRQFISALKKILVHQELEINKNGNCSAIENYKILVCSSHKNPTEGINKSSRRNFILENEETTHNDNILADYCLSLYFRPSEYLEETIAYIAGFIVRKTEQTIFCSKCIEALYSSEKNWKLIDIKSSGGLIFPSWDTIKICKETEILFRRYLNMYPLSEINTSKVETIITDVLIKCLDVNIFESLKNHALDTEPEHNHLFYLVKCIAMHYINIRLHYEAKQNTLFLHKQKIRQKFTKLVLFKGQ